MVQSLARVRDFHLLHSVQIGHMVQSLSCLLGTGVFFMGVKWQWHEADHTSSFSAEVTLRGSLTAVTHMPSCMFMDIFFYIWNETCSYRFSYTV